MSDNDLNHLRQQREQIAAQIRKLQNELDVIDALIQRERWSEVIKEANNFPNLSKKNAARLRCWASVKLELIAQNKRNGRGLNTRELYDLVVRRGHIVKYSTFRGYIRNFAKENRIAKKRGSNKWSLVNSDDSLDRGAE